MVTRQYEQVDALTMVAGRSAVCALLVFCLLWFWRGLGYLSACIRRGGWALWLSALCWALIFTADILAYHYTTVANVLVMLSLEPLLAALLAWWVWGRRLALRTLLALLLALLSVWAMFQSDASSLHGLGALLALIVPAAAACNWLLIERAKVQNHCMLPAIFLGALMSLAMTAPFVDTPANIVNISGADCAWLVFSGALQLGLPCVLATLAAQHLHAHESAMLGLLEIVLGIAWAWGFAGEEPSTHMLQCGAACGCSS